mgnify:CR=1 FL=1
MRRRSPLGLAATYATLVLATVIALFPIFWTVSTAIKERVDTYTVPPKFLLFAPTFRNFRNLFADSAFLDATVITIGITLASTAVAVLVGSLTGYALARQPRFATRRPLEVSLVFVRALPGVVLVIPLYDLFTDIGLYDNLLAVTLVYGAANAPFAAWLMTSFVRQVPVELEEAASVDGARRLEVLGRVILPLVLPGMAATFIFVALLAWNEFLIPALLLSGQHKTLPVFISAFIGNRFLDWGPMAAAASVAMVPIALFTIVVQRHLVAGLATGAVKE